MALLPRTARTVGSIALVIRQNLAFLNPAPQLSESALRLTVVIVDAWMLAILVSGAVNPRLIAAGPRSIPVCWRGPGGGRHRRCRALPRRHPALPTLLRHTLPGGGAAAPAGAARDPVRRQSRTHPGPGAPALPGDGGGLDRARAGLVHADHREACRIKREKHGNRTCGSVLIAPARTLGRSEPPCGPARRHATLTP